MRTLIRDAAGTFTPIEDVAEYLGDCDYVPGAIDLTIDGFAVLDIMLWDDVNWLWPFLVRAVDEALLHGHGETHFPSTPILFQLHSDRTNSAFVISVTAQDMRRSARAPMHEFVDLMRVAGLRFFENLERICPDSGMHNEIEILHSWPSECAS